MRQVRLQRIEHGQRCFAECHGVDTIVVVERQGLPVEPVEGGRNTRGGEGMGKDAARVVMQFAVHHGADAKCVGQKCFSIQELSASCMSSRLPEKKWFASGTIPSSAGGMASAHTASTSH